MARAGTLFLVPGEKPMPPVTVRVVARGLVKSKGPEAINRQLDTFKAAVARSGAAIAEGSCRESWMAGPSSATNDRVNHFSERGQYRPVVTAGFILQIDDPGLPDW